MLKMLATEHLQNSRAKYKPIISGTASPSWVCWTPFAVYKHGQAELSELGKQLRSIGLPERIALDYAKESAKLFSDCKVSEKYPGASGQDLFLLWRYAKNAMNLDLYFRRPSTESERQASER
jgi:hypothetical protein